MQGHWSMIPPQKTFSYQDLVIVECEGTTSNTGVSTMSNGHWKMETLDYVKSFLPT